MIFFIDSPLFLILIPKGHLTFVSSISYLKPLFFFSKSISFFFQKLLKKSHFSCFWCYVYFFIICYVFSISPVPVSCFWCYPFFIILFQIFEMIFSCFYFLIFSEFCGDSVAIALLDMHECDDKRRHKRFKDTSGGFYYENSIFRDQPRSPFRLFM